MVTCRDDNIPSARSRFRVCLSCGEQLLGRKRLFCSISCRRSLSDSLNRRTGLLVALNTRYATFYFDEFLIVMDILPYGMDKVFSFIMPRRPGKKPVEDYRVLANALGTAWWQEKNRTHKRYMASTFVLSKGKTRESPDKVIPARLNRPTVRVKDLLILDLDFSDLKREGISDRIKKAYRMQAKKFHPDLGGDPVSFRRLKDAYETLISWSEKPTFSCRLGLPDKWVYEGRSNRWFRPTLPRRDFKVK